MVHKLFLGLCCFASLQLSSASIFDLCPLDLNETITNSSNITWAQVTNQTILQFGAPSYLRPDVGGALLPWIYSIVVLIVHIPIVIIRVVKWQTVQTWCLAATAFTIALTAQAYKSTGFGADKILTWTPLLLVIDAGSMAQVTFLIIEQYSLLTRLRHAINPRNRTSPDDASLLLREYDNTSKFSTLEAGVSIQLHERNPSSTPIPFTPLPPPFPPLFTSQPLYLALTAILLLFCVFILQILGITHALDSSHLPAPPVSWCSPIFQPFGITVLDGNCNNWPITESFGKGVGCINISGAQQLSWLQATVAGTAIAIVLELLDCVILASVHTSTRWRGIKMRRPWFTMFSGIAVLGLVLIFGITYASMLPPGISERVWVVTQAGGVTVYEGELGPAGLRGAMIGWNDGVFKAWGSTYMGTGSTT